MFTWTIERNSHLVNLYIHILPYLFNERTIIDSKDINALHGLPLPENLSRAPCHRLGKL